MILSISLAFGAIVFIRLIGPDAWLIRGLRGDKLGAVVALCSILMCGAAIFFLLRFSLEQLPIGASAASGSDPSPEYGADLHIWDIISDLLAFCIPIATGCLLSIIYRGVYCAVQRFALR